MEDQELKTSPFNKALQNCGSDDFELPIGPPPAPLRQATDPDNGKQLLANPFGPRVGVVFRNNIHVSDFTNAPVPPAHLDILNPKSWNAAAAQGNPLARAVLGDALCWGGFAPHGIARDVPQGIRFLEESSHQGHPLGLYMLSRAQRDLSGYRQHPNIANQTETRAVHAGFLKHDGAGGAVWWTAEAIACQEGRIVPFDVDRKLALIRRSLDVGYTDAWALYAICLIEGEGIPKNVSEGIGWLKRAAEAQNGVAMMQLANCYRLGIGVKRNTETAVLLYNMAAQNGQDDAWNLLGVWLRSGIGHKRDELEAYRCYQKAAGAGNPHGFYNVGFCFEKGIGVKIDMHSAAFWYAKAVELGNRKAEDGINRVGKHR